MGVTAVALVRGGTTGGGRRGWSAWRCQRRQVPAMLVLVLQRALSGEG